MKIEKFMIVENFLVHGTPRARWTDFVRLRPNFHVAGLVHGRSSARWTDLVRFRPNFNCRPLNPPQTVSEVI